MKIDNNPNMAIVLYKIKQKVRIKKKCTKKYNSTHNCTIEPIVNLKK